MNTPYPGCAYILFLSAVTRMWLELYMPCGWGHLTKLLLHNLTYFFHFEYFFLFRACPFPERQTDNDGPYYWHIKSGTIQREPPLWPKNEAANDLKTPMGFVNPTSPFSAQNTAASAKITSTASSTMNNTNPLMQLFGSKGDINDVRRSPSNRLQVRKCVSAHTIANVQIYCHYV